MTTTYTKTLITDEATDTDSPITETLMQDIGQSVNWTIDAIDNTSTGHDHDGTGSKKVTAINLDGIYTSAWVSIVDGGSHDFAHGLGYSPTHVLVYDTPVASWSTVNCFASVDRMNIDSTNVQVYNKTGSGSIYFLVVAW